jgi:pimeloyl-ACP methyl ester carboxylesterase
MKLHYRIVGDEGFPLIILHGLFGFSDNWQTHAKKLSSYFKIILVDLRNHGHSPWSDDFSYQLMVEDVSEVLSELQIHKCILLGHSMGGKVAMHFAQQYPEKLEKLIVVDIGIKSYPMHHQHILEGIHAIDTDHLSNRKKRKKSLKNISKVMG